jgi:hypothetical protein
MKDEIGVIKCNKNSFISHVIAPFKVSRFLNL